MPISDELKAIFASAKPPNTYVEVLRFKHPQFTQTWYMTNHPPADGVTPWSFKDENNQNFDTVFVPFQIALPQQDGQGRQDMSIVIGNIGRELVDEIEAANTDPQTPIECTLLWYIDKQGEAPHADPINLTVTDPVVTLETVTLTASRADILNKPFPANNLASIYNTETFPGLRR